MLGLAPDAHDGVIVSGRHATFARALGGGSRVDRENASSPLAGPARGNASPAYARPAAASFVAFAPAFFERLAVGLGVAAVLDAAAAASARLQNAQPFWTELHTEATGSGMSDGGSSGGHFVGLFPEARAACHRARRPAAGVT